MGRPAKVERAAVMAAATSVLTQEGLGALSLDRLATELGVTAPSLYYHYKDKSAILDELAYALLSDLGVSSQAKSWKEVLLDYCAAFFDKVAAQPGLVVLLIEHMPHSAVLRAFEHNTRALARAGVPVWARAIVLESVQHFLWGLTMYVAVGEVNPAFTRDVDKQKYPAWAEALEARPVSSEVLLRAGVQTLIDGVIEQTELALSQGEDK